MISTAFHLIFSEDILVWSWWFPKYGIGTAGITISEGLRLSHLPTSIKNSYRQRSRYVHYC